jgi:hypothetical protein
LEATVNMHVLQLHDKGAVAIVLTLPEDLSKFLNRCFTLEYLGYTMQLCRGQTGLDKWLRFDPKSL